ncbi:Shedu anti-phage system protein SduA domain-containing protein [Chloroflexota bacterium]
MNDNDYVDYDDENRFLFDDALDDVYRDESEAVYWEKIRNLSKEEYENRHLESHKDVVRIKKLEKYMVRPHQKLSLEETRKLNEIISSSQDERPLQKFLEDNPFVLTSKIHPAHHLQICIPTPNLGGLYKPDYLIAGLDSAGFWWYGVELENPHYRMFNKNGEQTKELSHAIRQIEDWREWLRNNISYAQNTLGFIQIDADLPCYIIIGTRNQEIVDSETLQNRQRAVMKRDKNSLLLHHYEWLSDDKLNLVRVR